MSVAGSGGRVQPARPGDPSRVGPYRIIGRLGSGGMGVVHAGLTTDGLRVAVKVIHPAQAEDPEFRARFRREVQLSARVQGPCLVPLLAADAEAAEPWLATAYAPGPTLNQHLSDRGPLADGTLYAFATGTAQALAAIHQAGVVHRDVKPQNVILTPAGPRVLDFGIARASDGTSVTRTGIMTGTPGWISPEYYRSSTAGPEGDMFAWGALVAYAATGRLPFGTGAPDAVAFRVMSGDPDLVGVPEQLREILERALAKDPSERMTALEAAEECSRLLASQATRVLGGDGGLEPTLVGGLITTEWHMPTLDDQTWHAPSSSTRRRTIATVLVAAAVAGGIAGAALAFPTNGDSDALGDTSVAQSPTGRSTVRTETRAHAPVPTTRAGGAGDASESSADPRSAVVPSDPLAGVPDPAFTRAGDVAEPMAEEWRASTVASTSEEKDVEKAIRDRMAAMLATKDMDFMTPTVTFNKRAQTVMVTGGPISQIPEDHQEVFRRAGDMAACTALAYRLMDHPTTWSYGRFVISWKNFDGDLEPSVLGFGEATDGCYNVIAGQWQGDEFGIATAGIPSSDKAEIRVADATDKAITAAWDARIAEGQGLEPFAASDAIDLGFDPVERAAYVWARDTDGALIGRAQRADFQDAVSTTLCRKLTAEYNSNQNWNYTRWSVAVYEGNSRVPELIGSGECTR
ncbi:serine/threonine-protein kinase [Streptomyces sp. NPDC007264]|uniref:serine/threonine-protein kinase n=1 Tax=Streptomyces sp. NPDC007264 TaxID=3364777 RepID=UPI0036D8C62A